MARLHQSEAWRALERAADRLSGVSLRDLFHDDGERFARFCARGAGLLLDYSKNAIDDGALRALLDLAAARDLNGARAAMFNGEAINQSEGRAVLHVALRAADGADYRAEGRPVSRDVEAVRQRMADFTARVHGGALRGATGQLLDTVVNIGIGGSDLGPRMAVSALRNYWTKGRRTIFVSNVDGADLRAALDDVDPHRTLFLIASKTFTTQETMANAHSARAWFLEQGMEETAIASHFAALSTNIDGARAFGVAEDHVFGFWDWVGGRYSLWSAVGLSVALQIGWRHFEALLGGARAMDEHFRDAPIERNLPALLALVGVWNRNFQRIGAHAILPYDQRLEKLPAYLQQADMESNGKRVTKDGEPVEWETGPLIFGEPGTNGQHAFYQLLHQGTDVCSADFIAAARADHGLPGHHEKLLANALAQAEALMAGRAREEAAAQMRAAGEGAEEIARLAPHRAFPGDRPSNFILLDRLDPARLGALIALYEHKIFCQGVVWDVNSFDQWGVELGKTLAKTLLPALESGAEVADKDSSTSGLLREIAALRREKGST